MAKKGKSLCNRIVSLMLAMVMVITTFVVVSPIEVEAATKTKKLNSSVTIKDSECYSASGQVNTYYLQYKPNKTGYVTLTFKSDSVAGYSAGYVTLCNNNKKAIGVKEDIFDTRSEYANKKTYGVKKKVTYYFKVQCYAGTKITAKTVEVAKSTGNTRAKAKTLTKSKATKGIMIANENKADWYKINLTKGGKLRLKFTVATNGWDPYASSVYAAAKGGIKVTFYDTNGKKWSSNASMDLTVADTKRGSVCDVYLKSGGSKYGIPSGTYWVKVERMNKYSSGYYTVKWTTF